MVNNDRSYAVPKPFKSTKPTKVKGHLSGPTDQLTSVYNAILSSPDCIEVHYQPATRGETEENTWLITAAMRPTKRRKEKPEQPYVDKSGEIYLMQSLETVGRYKLGESIHPRQRLQEVIDNYGERFRIIAINYASTDRFARESWLKKEIVTWGAKHLEREAFAMTDAQVERFISLPNE